MHNIFSVLHGLRGDVYVVMSRYTIQDIEKKQQQNYLAITTSGRRNGSNFLVSRDLVSDTVIDAKCKQ